MSVIHRIILSSVIVFIVLCTPKSPSPQWNNPLDPDGTDYFPPTTEPLTDTVIATNDTLTFTVFAFDTAAGTVTKYLWSQNGNKFDTTENSTRSFVWHVTDTTDTTVFYTVIDNDGLIADIKSVTITILPFPPIVKLPPPFIIPWDEEASITISAEDNGNIEYYIWKTSVDTQWDTTDISELTIRHPEGGRLIVTVGAIDNDGAIGFSETSIRFNRPPEKIEIDYPYSGHRHIFDEIDFTDTIGTIIGFGLTATDLDGEDDSLRYAVEIINTEDNISRIFNNVTDSIWLDSLYPDHRYHLIYKAFDQYGDSVTSDVVFQTQNFFPRGMVFFPREPEFEIHHPFWIDTTEVTIEEYTKFVGGSCDNANCKIPVNAIDISSKFFWKLNGTYQADIGYRTPLRDEWIRAYKNPSSKGIYFWGSQTHQDIVKKYAWYALNANSAEWTIPHALTSGLQTVAQLLPNEYGLYDLSGNVAEEIILNPTRKSYLFTGEEYYIGGDSWSSVNDLATKVYWRRDIQSHGIRKVYSQIYR